MWVLTCTHQPNMGPNGCMAQQLFIALPRARAKQELSVDVYFLVKTQAGEPFQRMGTDRFLCPEQPKS